MSNVSPDESHQADSTSSFASGVLLGAIIGAAAVYVFSGPDGKKKAKKLLFESDKFMTHIEKHVHDVADHGEDIVQDVTPESISSKVSSFQSDVGSALLSMKKKFFKKRGRNLTNLW